MRLAWDNLFTRPEDEIDADVQQSEEFLETMNRSEARR
jgi:hypothetical protein